MENENTKEIFNEFQKWWSNNGAMGFNSEKEAAFCAYVFALNLSSGIWEDFKKEHGAV